MSGGADVVSPARLEDGLGLVLVRRSPRRVSPTPEGRRLAKHARRLLRDLDAVEAGLRGGDGMTGPIVLSTPPALGRRRLAPSLAAFCKDNPAVRLDWSLGAGRVDLIAEEVDVAVRFGPSLPPGSGPVVCCWVRTTSTRHLDSPMACASPMRSLRCLAWRSTSRIAGTGGPSRWTARCSGWRCSPSTGRTMSTP